MLFTGCPPWQMILKDYFTGANKGKTLVRFTKVVSDIPQNLANKLTKSNYNHKLKKVNKT